MRNIDFQTVRPAELHAAETNTAPKAFGAHGTGHRPMFHYR